MRSWGPHLVAHAGRRLAAHWPVSENPRVKTALLIATAAALKRMVAPGLMAVLIPVIAGFADKHFLAGLLVGTLASGVLLAIFMANAGGAWDNAKKYIETGHHGGKGSESHKAGVVGDTVGDPFKDTSGPSLNILVKLMSVVAVIIAPLVIEWMKNG